MARLVDFLNLLSDYEIMDSYLSQQYLVSTRHEASIYGDLINDIYRRYIANIRMIRWLIMGLSRGNEVHQGAGIASRLG